MSTTTTTAPASCAALLAETLAYIASGGCSQHAGDRTCASANGPDDPWCDPCVARDALDRAGIMAAAVAA